MAWLPSIRDYKPFFVQGAEDSSAVDVAQYGMIAKVNPYPLLPDAKEPYRNDWLDEDGEEEYAAAMHYKAMEFSVSFYVKTYDSGSVSAAALLRTQLDAFFGKVRNGDFKIYDSYTGLGRQKVRYVGYKEDGYMQRENWARLIFTATFKANDPITRVVLSNGKLVAE